MPDKKLKTLHEHNAERYAKYLEAKNPRANGIECPACGDELWDETPGIVLTSDPPKMDVMCHKCDYVGYRLV